LARPKQVDSKVPRGKAAFHTLLPAAAFVLGALSKEVGLAIIGLTGLAMAVSVAAGPRYSLIGLLFRQLRKAFNLKPGKPEEAAPHVFAEAVGAVFLLSSAAALAFLSSSVLGWTLALIVVALAALNWLAGICVGCQVYLLIARLRGRVRLASS
jgi:uncharacterized protein DUF4395